MRVTKSCVNLLREDINLEEADWEDDEAYKIF